TLGAHPVDTVAGGGRFWRGRLGPFLLEKVPAHARDVSHSGSRSVLCCSAGGNGSLRPSSIRSSAPPAAPKAALWAIIPRPRPDFTGRRSFRQTPAQRPRPR